MNLIEKFKSKFTEGDKDSCWNWEFGVTAGGYGQMAYDRKKYASHRLSWSYYNGKDIPKGHVIMHKCDNPRCVNPNHLMLGTQSDNVKDMMIKGRFKDHDKVGENNPSSVVKSKDVTGVYESSGTHESIAKKFNYPLGAIKAIRLGRTWKHITSDLKKGARGTSGAKGELNGKCSTTKEMVIEIYEAKGDVVDLMRLFLCSHSTIYSIKAGKTWNHITKNLIKG